MDAGAGFEGFFRDQFAALVGLGVAMAGSVEVARDLAQEAMLRTYRRWDDVAVYDNPAAWVRRVMINLLIDHHRSRTAERAAFGRLDVAESVELDVAGVEWGRLVMPLTARQRVIVALHYGEDQSVGYIAEMLGVAPGTVKSALSRARRRLHEMAGSEVDHDR